jgi:hypothetical protein
MTDEKQPEIDLEEPKAGQEISSEVKTEDGEKALAAHSHTSIPVAQRMELLREAMVNPDVQPEKAVAMVDLMFKLEDRERSGAFIAAKVAALSEMPAINKTGWNDHLKAKFGQWETMHPIITPILKRHGLVLSFKIDDSNGRVSVTPKLSGHGWEEEGGTMALPHDQGKGRNNVQAVGSAQKYGMRYAAVAFLNLNIIDEVDDDGAAAGGSGRDKLDDYHQRIVDNGKAAAEQGVDAYEAWFKDLSPASLRGWLVHEGYHDENKRAAGIT